MKKSVNIMINMTKYNLQHKDHIEKFKHYCKLMDYKTKIVILFLSEKGVIYL